MNKLLMRRAIFIFFFSLLSASIFAQQYKKPALSSKDSWSMILVPDPQTYVKFERNQPLFDLMTAWISENVDSLNIKMVLCTGDLVEQNEIAVADNINGNQPSTAQWLSVSKAFSRLDGKVPYVTAAGNHDFGYKNVENRKSNFHKYFPPEKNFLNQKILRDAGQNIDGVPTLENAAFELTAPSGKKFLIISLEFAPRDTTIEWAKKVAALPKYKDHIGVVLTHSYLNAQNEHIVKERYPVKDANYGAAMWEKLVKPSKNIQMVFSGHIGAPDNIAAHIGYRTDVNAGGKKVHQMVFNAQALGGGWHGNGGDGWLRILEFMPDGKTVKVKTFSPLFAISPSTRQFAWRTSAADEFTFALD
jgi:hypothetical protein